MAQTANPDPQSTSIDGNGPTPKRPAGNGRIGPGVGGTDNAVVARLFYDPEFITQGETKDSRERIRLTGDPA